MIHCSFVHTCSLGTGTCLNDWSHFCLHVPLPVLFLWNVSKSVQSPKKKLWNNLHLIFLFSFYVQLVTKRNSFYFRSITCIFNFRSILMRKFQGRPSLFLSWTIRTGTELASTPRQLSSFPSTLQFTLQVPKWHNDAPWLIEWSPPFIYHDIILHAMFGPVVLKMWPLDQ